MANIHSELLHLNNKLDSIRRAVAAVLAKELNPYLLLGNTVTPTPANAHVPVPISPSVSYLCSFKHIIFGPCNIG